jgi:glyoxalase family protein
VSELKGLVKGLHHITLVTSNEEVNRRFYTEVLGLRRVKLSVNQDDIFHRHLFYGDEQGTTGSVITFFEWPGLPQGTVGLFSPHHLSYRVDRVEALPKWRAWLKRNGVPVSSLMLRGERVSIYLRDPDGVLIEITAPNGEGLGHEDIRELERELPSVTSIGPDMKLRRFDHASPITDDHEITRKFYEKLLGLEAFSLRPNPDDQGSQLALIGNADDPSFMSYLFSPEPPMGFVGIGSIHHIAMAVEDKEDQLRIMRRLEAAGIRTSGIIDRFWFRSLYFRDPHGNLLEIATRGPGYAVDEPMESLGSRLILPPWLEPHRAEIEARLKEQDERNRARWPPLYAPLPPAPEGLASLAR